MAKRGRKPNAEKAKQEDQSKQNEEVDKAAVGITADQANLTNQEVMDICSAVQAISLAHSGRDYGTIRRIQDRIVGRHE